MSHCASCNRSYDDPKEDTPIIYQGIAWCPHCAKIVTSPSGTKFISQPSPGQSVTVNINDPLEAWIDCFEMKPKKRLLKKTARQEIQRAWQLWGGDKTRDNAMFEFFCWLNRHRPYFLTFRHKDDPWQTVHCWLIQYESHRKGNH